MAKRPQTPFAGAENKRNSNRPGGVCGYRSTAVLRDPRSFAKINARRTGFRRTRIHSTSLPRIQSQFCGKICQKARFSCDREVSTFDAPCPDTPTVPYQRPCTGKLTVPSYGWCMRVSAIVPEEYLNERTPFSKLVRTRNLLCLTDGNRCWSKGPAVRQGERPQFQPGRGIQVRQR